MVRARALTVLDVRIESLSKFFCLVSHRVETTAAACPDEQVCGRVRLCGRLCEVVLTLCRSQCFNVRCTGSLDGEVVGSCSNRTIKVKIVDA